MIAQTFGNPLATSISPEAAAVFQRLREDIGHLPILSVIDEAPERLRAEKIAEKFERFSRVLVFGIGGSSLGAQAISSLKDRPRVQYIDNVDPWTMTALLHSLNPQETGIILISKSGQTLETMAQGYLLVEHFLTVMPKANLKNHFLALTEESPSPLRQLSEDYAFPAESLLPGIGGRFSVFSLVGLLPLAIEGFSPTAFHTGASQVLKEFQEKTSSLATEGALYLYGLFKNNQISQHVLMPYSDRLFTWAQWSQQLIGESLGKKGLGLTPLAAKGSVDQHSQLQLYIDGPRDKSITLVTLETRNKGPKLQPSYVHNSLSYLEGRTLGDVLWAEAEATFSSLVKRGCFTRQIYLPLLDEHNLGALMMLMVLEVLLLAELMEINPFDQPAVEEGKILAKQILQKMG